jgi:hypothetical protein
MACAALGVAAGTSTPDKDGGLMISNRALLTALIGTLGAFALPLGQAHAQALPTPKQLISGLDLAPVSVALQHLNPLFAHLPQFQVILEHAVALMVPVAKNGAIPPND